MSVPVKPFIGDLFEKRLQILRKIQDFANCGGLSTASKIYFDRQLQEVEQNILQAQDYVCPHCRKSLLTELIRDFQI